MKPQQLQGGMRGSVLTPVGFVPMPSNMAAYHLMPSSTALQQLSAQQQQLIQQQQQEMRNFAQPSPHALITSAMSGSIARSAVPRVNVKGGLEDLLLGSMSVKNVCEMVERLEGLSSTKLPIYLERLHENNITGLVLINCDLTELKPILAMTFGDWELFKALIVTLRERESQQQYESTATVSSDDVSQQNPLLQGNATPKAIFVQSTAPAKVLDKPQATYATGAGASMVDSGVARNNSDVSLPRESERKGISSVKSQTRLVREDSFVSEVLHEAEALKSVLDLAGIGNLVEGYEEEDETEDEEREEVEREIETDEERETETRFRSERSPVGENSFASFSTSGAGLERRTRHRSSSESRSKPTTKSPYGGTNNHNCGGVVGVNTSSVRSLVPEDKAMLSIRLKDLGQNSSSREARREVREVCREDSGLPLLSPEADSSNCLDDVQSSFCPDIPNWADGTDEHLALRRLARDSIEDQSAPSAFKAPTPASSRTSSRHPSRPLSRASPTSAGSTKKLQVKDGDEVFFYNDDEDEEPRVAAGKPEGVRGEKISLLLSLDGDNCRTSIAPTVYSKAPQQNTSSF